MMSADLDSDLGVAGLVTRLSVTVRNQEQVGLEC